MKQIIKYSLISFVSLISLSGCLDDMDPISSIGEGGFYANQDEIYQAVIACYNGLQAPMTKEWYLTELRSDNSRLYGSGSESTESKDIRSMDMYRIDTSHPVNNDFWRSTYHNIANCNVVLKHAGVVTNDSIRHLFEAEARFIRAYHYFNLVRLYGPVFIADKAITGDEANDAERKPVDEVYALIEADLRYAEEYLPPVIKATDKGRVDRWGAKALLAKVYMTLGKLNDAKSLLVQVEETAKSGYRLLANYSDVFSINNEMNNEIIFAVRYKAGNIGLGSPFANYFAPANSFALIVNGGGNGYNCPTTELIQSYEANDKRKDITLASTWQDEANKTVYVAYVKKFLSKIDVKNDGENDWPVIRYADILLMLAEIENEQSGPSAGLVHLNATRVRAGLPSLTINDVPDKNKFREALSKERRMEFAFENQRFYDLQRTNQLIPVMQKHFQTELEPNRGTGDTTPFYMDPTKPTYLNDTTLEEWQLLLPIPFNVVSVSPNATQNPGY